MRSPTHAHTIHPTRPTSQDLPSHTSPPPVLALAPTPSKTQPTAPPASPGALWPTSSSVVSLTQSRRAHARAHCTISSHVTQPPPGLLHGPRQFFLCASSPPRTPPLLICWRPRLLTRRIRHAHEGRPSDCNSIGRGGAPPTHTILNALYHPPPPLPPPHVSSQFTGQVATAEGGAGEGGGAALRAPFASPPSLLARQLAAQPAHGQPLALDAVVVAVANVALGARARALVGLLHLVLPAVLDWQGSGGGGGGWQSSSGVGVRPHPPQRLRRPPPSLRAPSAPHRNPTPRPSPPSRAPAKAIAPSLLSKYTGRAAFSSGSAVEVHPISGLIHLAWCSNLTFHAGPPPACVRAWVGGCAR